MLVIMVQDVADIIYSLFHSFFFPSQVLLAHLPPSSFLYGSYSFSLVCSTPPPPTANVVRTGKLDFGDILWHVASVLNLKCARCAEVVT